MSENRAQIAQAKRIVVKVGSALLSDPVRGLAHEKIQAFSAGIAALQSQGRQVILVSSGAIAEGCVRLGWTQRPALTHKLQAAAAVGQMGLAQAYESALAAHACRAAMIMLTHDDLADRQRYLNARTTLNELLRMNVVPVINENDTVATDEIRFGDNDTLAALVTNLVGADLLVILTDVAGMMSADPRQDPGAERIAQAAADDASLDARAGADAGHLGRGGMQTKLRAARLAARSGADTVIASGHEQDILDRVLSGEDTGTLLTATLSPMTARKRWIANQLKPRGIIYVDEGAARAVRESGVSLLAVGVVGLEGQFERGDVVTVQDQGGQRIAQGLTNYSSKDVARLKGVQSEDFARHIDFVGEPELVHRDNLVVL